MFIEQIEKSKKENDVKNIMENNIIALRKIKKLQKSITNKFIIKREKIFNIIFFFEIII